MGLMVKKVNFLKSLWVGLKTNLFNIDRIKEFLKGKAVKLAIKKILGSAAMGGFKAWLIKFIVTELFEEIAEPIIDLGVRKIGYVVDVVDANFALQFHVIQRADVIGFGIVE